MSHFVGEGEGARQKKYPQDSIQDLNTLRVVSMATFVSVSCGGNGDVCRPRHSILPTVREENDFSGCVCMGRFVEGEVKGVNWSTD